MIAKVHSIQSLGAVDGPGIRFVVFLSGCNLRCGFCHNPDTWQECSGTSIDAKELFDKAVRYKEYFKNGGGVTVSGGEPLLQAKAVKEFFTLCKQNGINTCLDSSGSILTRECKELLDVTDRVLLDIKFTKNELYEKYVGCSISKPLEFLEYLNKKGIPVTLRQVIVPSLNDNAQNILALKGLKDKYRVIDKIELLPFRKICDIKYKNLGIPFPFEKYPEPTTEQMQSLEQILKEANLL